GRAARALAAYSAIRSLGPARRAPLARNRAGDGRGDGRRPPRSLGSARTPREVPPARATGRHTISADLVASVLTTCELARYAPPRAMPSADACRKAIEQMEQIVAVSPFTLVVSSSNHEPRTTMLVLRQAQDER